MREKMSGGQAGRCSSTWADARGRMLDLCLFCGLVLAPGTLIRGEGFLFEAVPRMGAGDTKRIH